MKFTTFSTTALTVAIVLSVIVMGWMITGCTKDSATGPVPSSTPMVNMAVSFSKSGTAGLFKLSDALFTDSLHIDSAVVVFSRIQFLQHADSVLVDTSDKDQGEDGHDSSEQDNSISFKGPFVVHVRDTVGINFASKELPAGIYDGIKFKIHRLQRDEDHEDSDEHNHRHHNPAADSTFVGSSITVWGSVYKNGEWQPFKFSFDGEFEFKVKGNFVVPTSTSSVNIALNIDMGKWFRNPNDGSLLDPTDTSHDNLSLIRRAIRFSFGSCRGGHDRGDGHPDH
jgi:hypothetical protein